MSHTVAGHRGRLLNRFAKAGLAGLHDYEILELTLTLVIARSDTKPTAKRLLQRYGSISAVLSAPQRELVEVEGVGEKSAQLLAFLNELQGYCLQEKYTQKCYIRTQHDVESYLTRNYSDRVSEYAVVLFLDSQNRVMTTEVVSEGSVDHCTIYPRKIFDRAFQAGAASILLAHNHPGGSKEPSEADWAITKRLHSAGKLLDIQLVDHIIVADGSTISLRGQSRWPHN